MWKRDSWCSIVALEVDCDNLDDEHFIDSLNKWSSALENIFVGDLYGVFLKQCGRN